ncbi:hypothetical protein Ddye_018741 [Dipteronia dyeriana]|uniref:RING-type E3 ubiquitin transferase n=1 Tax=Dipteronia dyeriana TaxID=168575 RepID=A0AAD9UBS3_9ROSI|nr:hypothetical protein Ddye_018741 [Dipteronia dyeriana]
MVLFSAFHYSATRPSEPLHSNGLYSTSHPPMAIVILVPMTILLLIFLLYICIRNYAGSSPTVEVVLPCTAALSCSLDLCVIESFPLFIYSAVKDLKMGREAHEYTVCLSEFEDDNTLRLIPKCDHVFHRDCIGAWLDIHGTGSVCCANLTPEESNETDRSTESNIELTQRPEQLYF